MRYWHPFGEETAAQMEADGVDKVMLLPLYPQYSSATTGSALAYWTALGDTGEIPSWPTTTVLEYAANPKYVQALSERIDEGLQRFPRGWRADAQILFNAHGLPLRGRSREEDPYCCLVHSTVQRVMQYRGHDRPVHTAFQNRIGLGGGLSPSTSTTLEALARDEAEAVLAVPLTFATDHLLTSYGLDIEVRAQAETAGIPHFEVTSGLNTHPLFIEALAEATAAQLDLPVDVNQLRVGGDGLAQDYPIRPIEELSRYDSETHAAECPYCEEHAGARRWTVSDDAPDTGAVQAGDGQTAPDPASEPPGSRSS
jgi:ferrochelatase